uniref:Retrotransposon gag domain-containing protein n=1 Tax=Meloidogyne incognita TaxID=6306 RepID=A0A914NT88_MELIC
MSESTTKNPYLNILTEIESSGTQLQIFVNEDASAFDEWSTRFKDYIEVFGNNWTEVEKLNRLKFYLGKTARNIYENLAPSGKNTLQNALINIRAKLDSPHIRELNYKKLAACYQRKGESVAEFIKRLIPLVNSTSSNVTKEVKEEMLCRCFIEKVRPEFQRNLQLVAPLIGRKCFDKLATYVQELEINFMSKETNEENIKLIQGNESSWIQSTSNNTQQYTYENNASASPPKFSSEHEQYDYGQLLIENKDDEYKEYDCIEELKNEIEQMKEMINNLSEQIHELKMDGNY